MPISTVLSHSYEGSPLVHYRRMGSLKFDSLQSFIIGSDAAKYKEHLVEKLSACPVFHERVEGASLQEERHLTMRQLKALVEMKLDDENPNLELYKNVAVSEVIGCYSWSLQCKYSLLFNFPLMAISGMGTDRHRHVIDDLWKRRTTYCFALTELAHGSDARRMRTTATYDVRSGQFVLHTPDQRAAKCWIGALAETSWNAVVFAQLYTADGVCHGLHAFLVPLRDPATHLAYPGCTIGDMGHKLGLNGLDNGFVMFDNYRIPRESLLNKNGDVTEAGEYVSPIENDNLRFAMSLGTLSSGRVGITYICQVNMRQALTIALRYCAARRQFGADADTDTETPVIEYPLLQWRLFPYLAATYVWYHLAMYIHGVYDDFVKRKVSGDSAPEMTVLAAEIHALTSGTKPVSGWLARDCIQECREACGGHGYLAAGRLGELRGDNDANLTYEGDNNLLVQQLSNFLLRVGRLPLTETPLHSVDFLLQRDDQLTACPPDTDINTMQCDNGGESADTDINTIQFVTGAFEWLVRHLLAAVEARLQQLGGRSQRRARDHVQVHGARPLATAFIELFALRRFAEKVASSPDEATRLVMTRLAVLYGLWSLDRNYIAHLAAGSYLSAAQITDLQCTIRDLCTQLKPDFMTLVDVIAPHDFLLRSCLGHSDGQIYERMFQSFLSTPGCTQRPDWWQLCGQMTGRL